MQIIRAEQDVTGAIRLVEYDGERWVNLDDMKELVMASTERWQAEGNVGCASTMERFGATLGSVLG